MALPLWPQTVSDFNQPSIPSGVANNATDKAQTYSIDDSNTTLLIDGPKAVQPKVRYASLLLLSIRLRIGA